MHPSMSAPCYPLQQPAHSSAAPVPDWILLQPAGPAPAPGLVLLCAVLAAPEPSYSPQLHTPDTAASAATLPHPQNHCPSCRSRSNTSHALVAVPLPDLRTRRKRDPDTSTGQINLYFIFWGWGPNAERGGKERKMSAYGDDIPGVKEAWYVA